MVVTLDFGTVYLLISEHIALNMMPIRRPLKPPAVEQALPPKSIASIIANIARFPQSWYICLA